jgi:membrane protein DedA with SNARE-associated domain
MTSSLEWVIPYAQHFSYGGITAALVLTSIGLPIPEDILLLTAGFITAEGYANIWIMFVLTMCAVLVGDLVMYGLGHHFGEAIFRMAFFRRIFTPARQGKIHNLYKGHGKKTIFIVRFVPGLRSGVYVLAGASRMGVIRFFMADFLAAIISVPIFVSLGYFLAPHIEEVAKISSRAKIGLLLLIGLVSLGIFCYVKVMKKLITPDTLNNHVSTGLDNTKPCCLQNDKMNPS